MNISIIDVMNDELIFGKTFQPRLLRGDSWRAWRAFLTALFALPFTDEARALYEKHSGRTDLPDEPFREAYAICGRRSGKSVVAAMAAVYLACFRDYAGLLAPGEIGVLPIVAPDRKQCRVILNYITGFFEASPTLATMVKTRLKESIELTNRIRIEVHTASFRTVRGYTAIGCILDEVAFLRSEDSANPDSELIAAITPAMSTIPSAVLLGISTPYARRGVLWANYREHYGKVGAPVLIWRASSKEMNPTLSHAVIATAYLRDAASARAEYGGEFRDDITGFISREIVEARVDRGVFERAPVRGFNYVGFTDPSGGSSDSFTLSIAHREGDKAILDCVREVVPPFSPENVVSEFAQMLKSYGIGTVIGDAYAGEWPRERFLKSGIEYKVSDRTRSEVYLCFLPMMMSGTVQLLDNQRLVNQLVSLERRTARSGKDSIDHAPGSHDDVANAVAGALLEALGGAGELGLIEYQKRVVGGVYEEREEEVLSWEKRRALQFEMKLQGIQPGRMDNDPPPACPRCAGPRVCLGSVVHCNGCSADFANPTDKNPIREAPSAGPCCPNFLPQRVSGFVRCGNCGWQSNINQPTGISRKDIDSYAGGRAQFNPRGFHGALARMFGGPRK